MSGSLQTSDILVVIDKGENYVVQINPVTTITTSDTGTYYRVADYVSSVGQAITSSYALTASYVEGDAGITDWSEITNKPSGLVSSSQQVSYTGLSNIPSGILSSSTQINQLSNVTASFALTASYVSGAASTWDDISNKPEGLISSSVQINTGSFSGSFTGELIGTSSWALNAITSSFSTTASAATSITFVPTTASFSVTSSNAVTASFALTASFVTTTVDSASYALNADLLDGLNSATFSTTGSNVFIGNQIISGGIILEGDIPISASRLDGTGKSHAEIYYSSSAGEGVVGVFNGGYNYNTFNDGINYNEFRVYGNKAISLQPIEAPVFSGSLFGTGSWATSASLALTASYVEYDNVVNKPSLVSSSTQINTGSFSGSFKGDGSELTGLVTDLRFSGSIGSDTLSLLTDTLYVLGENGVSTTVTDNTVTIGIPTNFATTGSNTFTGNQIVSGGITLQGDIPISASRLDGTGKSYAEIYYSSSTGEGFVGVFNGGYNYNTFNDGVNYNEFRVYGDKALSLQPIEAPVFSGSLFGTGSWAISASLALTSSYIEYDNIVNKPSLVSSSEQINTGSFSGSFKGDGSQLTGLVTDLRLSGSVGSDTVSLLTDTLYVLGENGVSTTVTDNTVTIGIPTNFATTGSNTFTGIQTISNDTNSTVWNDGALIVAGGVGIAKDVNISGSLTIEGLLTAVSMSTQYVTSSQYTVGTSRIILNDDDLVRFSGISIIDSGSTSPTTASIFWDSLNNKFIYENLSGSTYNSAMFIAGPTNTGALGNEVGLVMGRIPVASDDDHIDNRPESSSIRVDFPSRLTHIEAGLIVTGSINGTITGSFTGSLVGTLTGTGSWASNAITASFAISSSRSVTSSFAVTASAVLGTVLSASYALNADTLDGINSTVFATTGSNTFNGNQTITGSVLTNADTLIFTGSIFTSGSLSVTGGSITGSLFGTASRATTASYALTASFIDGGFY